MSLSEPHTGQTVSPTMFIYLYICLYCMSFRKCVLIHWTASILLSFIQFCKFHYAQIIETASIFHLQWATTSMCTLLVQAESDNYSYRGMICRGPRQLRTMHCMQYAIDIKLHVHVHTYMCICCWCSRYSSS